MKIKQKIPEIKERKKDKKLEEGSIVKIRCSDGAVIDFKIIEIKRTPDVYIIREVDRKYSECSRKISFTMNYDDLIKSIVDDGCQGREIKKHEIKLILKEIYDHIEIIEKCLERLVHE